ncbi:MAG TPA: polyprenyl synthetase family protein [Thermoanaerobaculia bacterium]
MSRSTPAPTASPAAAGARSDGFSELLSGFRDKLDRALAEWIEAKRRAVAVESAGTTEAAAMLELIDGVASLTRHGGKRLRPALVYYTYRACGGRSDAAALPLALATELLHTYLLIHDDIMDHAEVRRGQPAAHVRFREAHRAHGWRGDARDFGASVGILLGDLAHTWAVELFAQALVDAPREAAELNRCFSAMCQEVIGGQYLELLVALRGGTAEQAGAEELLSVLRLKSGRYTAERPIQLGAILAGAPAERRAALTRYGGAVGEAFQLQDDLLGMFGDAETLGKPVGADLTEGKFTFLVYHALAAATPADRQAIEAAFGRPDLSGEEIARVQRILETTGARSRVAEMIDSRLAVAADALAGLDLADSGRTFFRGLLDYLREREQ